MQTINIRITADNLNSILPGDIIVGAEDMGRVELVRPTQGLEDNQVTITTIRTDGTRDQDVFGIPQNLTLKRDHMSRTDYLSEEN